MDAEFIIETDAESTKADTAAFCAAASHNHLYSMEEIVWSIYGKEFATPEFWRVAPAIGDALRENGFKKVYYKNRRFWVKKK